jgi:quercetin dioxygenase-like cupin family protein
MLRRFDIGPFGFIGVHAHPEEHQMYILNGPIHLVDKDNKEYPVQQDTFVYMPPNEAHGYRNPNDYTVSFLCGIPKLEKK